jgi:tRNA nucleotidyltransferase (CCA-adding enzyme)
MVEQMNLTAKIERNFPEEALALMKQAVTLAGVNNLPLYLVAGMVRDLLLGLNYYNYDLDLAVEGDAAALAKEFAEKIGGKLTLHRMFNTAKIDLGKWTIDIAMARTETYAQPGALPAVTPGTLRADLYRRDFTVNAMAVSLRPENYGELTDPYGGRKDLKNKYIRILHNNSFVDDATRIWRAIRYEQRLDFQIEPDTLRLLKRDVVLLPTVGGYRLRRELEAVLKEKEPEKVLLRADELGVLQRLHPSLHADDWLASKFQSARLSGTANPDYYLGLLTCRLTEDEIAQITKYLRFSSEQIRVIQKVRASNI